jgi:hypothetical protein
LSLSGKVLVTLATLGAKNSRTGSWIYGSIAMKTGIALSVIATYVLIAKVLMGILIVLYVWTMTAYGWMTWAAH